MSGSETGTGARARAGTGIKTFPKSEPEPELQKIITFQEHSFLSLGLWLFRQDFFDLTTQVVDTVFYLFSPARNPLLQ